MRLLTTSVDTAPGDRELLPRAGNTEIEAFVVVVPVRVVAAADLGAGFRVFAALVHGGGDLRGWVALRQRIVSIRWEVHGRMWEARTVLPQVTAPWRFSMGAGAASTEAARAMVAMKEVYMLTGLRANVAERR
jgi:hypothetical protein